ncbi:MAG TPA: lytic transglycosylase domain-containing protein [Bacteroidales bacterium]|nr:lytic transglycosylase domain-containing protein [Bacteroidales bacterium]
MKIKSLDFNKWHIIILCACFILILLSFSKFQNGNPDNDYQNVFKKSYKILSPYIPTKIEFAGEKVPLELFYVKESLERELIVNTYWQSNTLLMIKRANRFFPIIENILKENNIPDDFKYLALIESNFDNVVSPAGATGFWQFMKEIAKKYGLEITDEIDERYNLEKATSAACKYLKELYRTFGSWTNTAAAYNLGSTKFNEIITTQKTNNYYFMSLNNETSRYIYRILAVKIILSNPSKYGFYLRKKDLYYPIPITKYSIDTTINNLADFAIKMKASYKILKIFNPWLRKNSLTNPNKKNYIICLPTDSSIYTDKILKIYEDDYFIINDTLTIDQLR